MRKLILVLDEKIPVPERNSGFLDTLEYIQVLLQLGYEVKLFAEDGPKKEIKVALPQILKDMGVECFYVHDLNALIHQFQAAEFRIDAIFIFRTPIAHRYLAECKSLLPNAKVIFAVVDLHYLRYERQAFLDGSQATLRYAKKIKKIEFNLINVADISIVLSQYEKKLLEEACPTAQVRCVPMARKTPVQQFVPLPSRRHILFIGDLEHYPNVDAINFFISILWPRLCNQGYVDDLIIVGNNAGYILEDILKEVSFERIRWLGCVKDEVLEKLFLACRLSIAPLRIGAGLKGKVTSSLSYGVPCICLPLAVEGSGLKEGTGVMVAQNGAEFVDKILEVYHDDILWQRLSETGRQFFCANYSRDVVFPQIKAVLHELGL